MQKAETSVIVAVRHEISAPVTGITLCTHVGRHSSTHFDNGFSVDSIPRPKGMRERHGEKVSSLERLNKLFVRDCRNQRWRKERRGAAAEPRVWGKYREEKPWNQRTAAGWTIGVIAFIAARRRCSSEALLQHQPIPSSIGRAVAVVTRPPAVAVSKFTLFETEGGTLRRLLARARIRMKSPLT